MKKEEKFVKDMAKLRKTNPVLFTVMLIVVAIVIIVGLVRDNGPQHGEPLDGIYVHYMDVGQGDAALIVCGGEYMLIDGSTVSMGDTIVDHLRSVGVDKLDYIVCTHAHADHCGGLDRAAEVFGADTVFVSPYPGSSTTYDIFLENLDKLGIDTTVPTLGETYTLGGATFRFIGPLEDYGDTNSNSLVLRLEYGSRSFLFTGDMEQDAEKDLLESGVTLRSDVLKVGHHGSRTSSSYRFLYEVEPEIAVISCGADNRYGHPHDEAMSRLSDADAEVLRTDVLGDIVIFSDGIEVKRAA